MEGLLLYKLMILYMLDRTDYTMTNSLISGFIVGKDYTSVFNLHESLSELINDEFISTDTIRDTIHYKITSSGEEALSYFENRLPYAIKEDILEYLKAERINVKKVRNLCGLLLQRFELVHRTVHHQRSKGNLDRSEIRCPNKITSRNHLQQLAQQKFRHL